MQGLSIKQVDDSEFDRLCALTENPGNHKDTEYFSQCFERQSKGELCILSAMRQGVDVGYCIMNWRPKYGYFKVHNIPEIQDLNVVKEHRNKGIGRAIILHCENLVRDRGYTDIGIGVGLHASYGAAQRLYMKMGYIPDGQGISYDRIQVGFGEFKPIDDQLCLMMVKSLKT